MVKLNTREREREGQSLLSSSAATTMTRMNSSNTQHKDEVGSLLEVMMVCTESEAGLRANKKH